MNVFITGGSGFVGGHIIEALTGAHTVFAMARSERSADKVSVLGATPVQCSLDDIAAQHLQGIDVVIHAAAYVEDWGPESAGAPATTRCSPAWSASWRRAALRGSTAAVRSCRPRTCTTWWPRCGVPCTPTPPAPSSWPTTAT